MKRLLIVALMVLAAPAYAGDVQLRDARLWQSVSKTRVVFDLSSDVQPDIFMLDNPWRLVVDLPDTRAGSAVAQNAPDTSAIRAIRTGIRHGRDARVVMDLSSAVQAKSFMLSPNRSHGYRLVVDLYPQRAAGDAPGTRVALRDSTPASTSSSSSPPRIAATKTAPGDAPEHVDEVTALAAQAARDKAPAVVDPNSGPARAQRARAAGRDIIVAIDAGHGGRDPGAHGPNGLLEKNVTLAIAKRLKAMVDAQPHMKGVLTRKRDVYVGLRERMVIARRDKADFFVSIHCNATPRGITARGGAVYALSAHGATSEHARWLARRENASDLVGGVSLKDTNSNLASFVLDLSQSASIDASMDAGQRVLDQLDLLGSLHKQHVQQAGFMVLKSPDIPSILVETNFISNASIEHRLATSHYQNQLATAILRGVKGYFTRYRPATYITAAPVYEVEAGDTLSEIAQQYGVSTRALRRSNDLSGNALRVGQTLAIPEPGAPQQLARRG